MARKQEYIKDLLNMQTVSLLSLHFIFMQLNTSKMLVECTKYIEKDSCRIF